MQRAGHACSAALHKLTDERERVPRLLRVCLRNVLKGATHAGRWSPRRTHIQCCPESANGSFASHATRTSLCYPSNVTEWRCPVFRMPSVPIHALTGRHGVSSYLRFEGFSAVTIKNCVALVRTYVSEERSASIIRVTRIDELEITLAVTSSRCMLRRIR
jgi:hypothetical protein